MANSGSTYNNRRKSNLVTEVSGNSASAPPEFFMETVTITSAAAATAVSVLSDARVGPDRKVYVLGVNGKVNGGTLWATTANVKIQDTNTSAVDFVTFLVAALTANAEVGHFTAGVMEDAMSLGTGGTQGKGLQIKGDANGTGSNFTVTIYGILK